MKMRQGIGIENTDLVWEAFIGIATGGTEGAVAPHTRNLSVIKGLTFVGLTVFFVTKKLCLFRHLLDKYILVLVCTNLNLAIL